MVREKRSSCPFFFGWQYKGMFEVVKIILLLNTTITESLCDFCMAHNHRNPTTKTRASTKTSSPKSFSTSHIFQNKGWRFPLMVQFSLLGLWLMGSRERKHKAGVILSRWDFWLSLIAVSCSCSIIQNPGKLSCSHSSCPHLRQLRCLLFLQACNQAKPALCGTVCVCMQVIQ